MHFIFKKKCTQILEKMQFIVPTHHTYLPTLILKTIKYLKNNLASFKPHLENKPANNLIKINS